MRFKQGTIFYVNTPYNLNIFLDYHRYFSSVCIQLIWLLIHAVYKWMSLEMQFYLCSLLAIRKCVVFKKHIIVQRPTFLKLIFYLEKLNLFRETKIHFWCLFNVYHYMFQYLFKFYLRLTTMIESSSARKESYGTNNSKCGESAK